MTYTWHDIDGRMAELCDECGFDARELTGEEDELRRLDAAYAELDRLLDHPDRELRPAEETWSAREYVDHCIEVAADLLLWTATTAEVAPPEPPVDLTGCRAACAFVVRGLTQEQRAKILPDGYKQPVTVEWLIRHMLHDTEHHVLDLRRGYARLAMARFPEVSFRR